eukprot:2523208-Alexandrium_andersonii.AAC.1
MPAKPRLSGCRFTPYTTAWKKFVTVTKRLRAYDARALRPAACSQPGWASGMCSTGSCTGISSTAAVTCPDRGFEQPWQRPSPVSA